MSNRFTLSSWEAENQSYPYAHLCKEELMSRNGHAFPVYLSELEVETRNTNNRERALLTKLHFSTAKAAPFMESGQYGGHKQLSFVCNIEMHILGGPSDLTTFLFENFEVTIRPVLDAECKGADND